MKPARDIRLNRGSKRWPTRKSSQSWARRVRRAEVSHARSWTIRTAGSPCARSPAIRARTRRRRSKPRAPRWCKGDIDDVESLKKAFAGAHGVYGVTNFWEHFSGEKEKAQAKNIADAAKAAGVKHVIWSTLEDTRKLMAPDDKRMPMLQEKYRVPHFDAKAEANAYFAGLPVTYLVTSFYWDNLYLFDLAPKKGADGVYSWTFPMGNAKLPGIAVEDIGKAAYGIFKAGQQHIGKTVGIAGESLTFNEMSDKLSKGLGISPVKFNAVDADVFRGFGFPGADEYGNMFQVYRDFEKEVGARSQHRGHQDAQPVAADLRQLGGEEQGEDSPEDAAGACRHVTDGRQVARVDSEWGRPSGRPFFCAWSARPYRAPFSSARAAFRMLISP